MRDEGTAPPWVAPGGTTPPPAATADDLDELPRPRRGRLVVAIFGALALLVAAVAYVGSGGDDDGAAVAPSTTAALDGEEDPGSGSSPPSSSTPGTSEPEVPPVSEAEFLALVDQLRAYVAEARGLQFLSEVDVELAGEDEFRTRLLEDFEESIDDITRAEVFYRALGLLAGEATLYEELRTIFSAGVLGFYDPETDELVVRGRSPTPYVQQTIVHELVHALDDQHFELDRPQYEDRQDEIELGFTAAVEGNASRIENQWLGEQGADFREEAREEEQAFADGIDLDAFPEILLFQIGAPYQLGEVFVGEVIEARGERGVDAAITDPPDTSEQFLFPPRYLAREPRVEVPAPPADGEIVDEGVIGALFLFGLFTTGGSSVNQADAVRAVDGWGGDWAVTWQEGDAACIRADFVGDTEGDTGEIEQALEAWVDGQGAGRVSRTPADRVRLESCGAAAGGAPPQI